MMKRLWRRESTCISPVVDDGGSSVMPMPGAPPEPPTKLRHDNPDRHHDQISAIKLLSNDNDKNHYSTMAREARAEYDKHLVEYLSTGL
jgi:hypothetical protein